MSEIKNEAPIVHTYDGIEERDNPMPVWWLWSFFLCIMFAAYYYIHYTSGMGPTLLGEYNEAYGHHLSKFKHVAGASVAKNISEEELSKKLGDFKDNELGAKVYARTCEACHANHLQGLVGPNLTDQYWIHGTGKTSDILKVVAEGVPEKGMPAWGPQLKDEEVLAVVGYIYSQRGTNPAGAKEPQGEAYPDYISK